MKVGGTRGDFAVFADRVAPIFEQFAVFEAPIEGIRAKSGGTEGIAPSGEVTRDLVLGDSGEREELRA